MAERDGDEYYISVPVVSANNVYRQLSKTDLWWTADGLQHEPSFDSADDCLVTFQYAGEFLWSY